MVPGRVSVVVLAAGRGLRFGADKLSAPFRGLPLLHHPLSVLDAAREAGILQGGVLVHGADDGGAAALAAACGLRAVPNRHPERGISHSLQLGLDALLEDGTEQSEWALVVLGDQPLIRREVIGALVDAAGDADLVRPAYREAPDTPGHPVLLHRRVWSLASGLKGDRGFGALPPDQLRTVEVAVTGTNPDIDTAADLARLESGVRP